MSEYEIRDPVYGFITFNEWEKEIIDHFVFQRLRRIKQLALTDMVYPGATHTRFEHSLGVMHLATKMYDAIIRDDSNKQLLTEKLNYQESGLKRDRQLVRLAALLHDVGHAPFSHASEAIISKNPVTGKPYKHEDY
jgi:HD superfamily phosphohydrolase